MAAGGNTTEYLTGYQAYDTEAEEDESPDQFLLNEDPPVHVHSNGNNTAQWNHIENLDDFFTRVYTYHQRHGFLCMVVEDFLQLGQFLFIVLFSGFLADCVDYDILFATKHPDTKQTLHNVIKTPCRCGFSIPGVAICMLIAFSFLIIRAVKVFYNLFKYWQIRQFYITALKIDSSDLDNKTWSEVQSRLMEVQEELQMCIHKNELSHLDIYHRILRFKNYFIAMVNKEVVPLKVNLPVIGDFFYLSHGLKFNLEFLLFWAPCNISPFENPWHLRAEYKNVHRRIQLAEQLSKNILVLGIVNLLLSPVIFLWEILYLFFVYGNIVKSEPGFLGSRKWSGYGKAFLRHFNELDHELNTRLCRAYDVSDEYLSGFMSPLMAVVAKFVSFFSGAVLVVLVCLTIYDEDTLQIEHMLTLITACGLLVSVSRIFIPPENHVFIPESKMVEILADTHYQPEHWRDHAHTSQVRDEFGQLFQFKAIFLLEELLSPIMCPLILIFSVRHKSLEIVDFFRNFTVEVLGAGDVCSFAQLDIRKHGNKKWSGGSQNENNNSYQQAEHGKTELSLMHFALTNPSWKPPSDCSVYLKSIREQAVRDASDNVQDGTRSGANPLTDSIMALTPTHRQSSLFTPRSALSGLGRSAMYRSARPGSSSGISTRGQSAGGVRQRRILGGMSGHEGPLADQPVSGGIIDALSQSGSYDALVTDISSPEYNSNEISLSVMYMHELNRRNQLNNITQAGYEDLESVRQVMTESELRPVPEFESVNEEFGSTSSSPSQSQHSLKS